MTQRTDQQRKAIEVYCRELAEALNDSGFELKAVLKVKQADVPWNQDLVKEILWKSIQQSATISEDYPEGKKSTTQLDIMEVDRVYSILDRHISSNFGVHIEFPSEESLYESRFTRQQHRNS